MESRGGGIGPGRTTRGRTPHSSPSAALQNLHMDRGRLGNTRKRLLQVAHRVVHGAAAGSGGNAASQNEVAVASRRPVGQPSRLYEDPPWPSPRTNLLPPPESRGASQSAPPRRASNLPRAAHRPTLTRKHSGGGEGTLPTGAGRATGSRFSPDPVLPQPWARSTRSTRQNGARRTKIIQTHHWRSL